MQQNPLLATPVVSGIPRVLWIETKAGKGKQSDAQAEFERCVIEVGHHYLVARSSDDVLAWLRAHR